MDLKYKHLFSFFQMIFFARGLHYWRISEISEIIHAFIFYFKKVLFLLFDYILAPVHQFGCRAEGK